MHPLLSAAAERQLGVFTAVDALRAGYGQAEIRQLRTSGRWRRLRRGVYITEAAVAEAERAGRWFQVECTAVLLALDSSTVAISHRSAARLWGLPSPRAAGDGVRLTDPAHGRTGRGFHVSRGPLDPAEVRVRGPLRLTSPARTLIDCAREWPLGDAVVAMDAGLLSGRVTREQVADAVARVRGWPGGSQAARVSALSDGRAESPLETRGRLRMVGAGLPPPELQVEIRTGGRLVGVVDAWFDDAAVAVEFDGQVTYTDPWRERSPGQVLWEEKRREDELRALDIGVVRIADADLVRGWARVQQQLHRLLRRPTPPDRRFTVIPRPTGIPRAG